MRVGRARVWFELRDARGALPCSMWRKDFDALAARAAWPTARRSSSRAAATSTRARAPRRPRFSFACHGAARRRRGRPARAARPPAARARTPRGCSSRRSGWRARCCRARSASSPARAARRATTSSRGCAAAAGPGGSCGRSPRSRTATPRRAITRALQDLAACAAVDVDHRRARRRLARRPVLRSATRRCAARSRCSAVPVIASVGHHTDRTLIDDVAAVCCSTPTHAAEAAVPVDCGGPGRCSRRRPRRLDRHGRRATSSARGRSRGSRARRPTTSRRQRARLHQHAARAPRRRAPERRRRGARRPPARRALERKADRGAAAGAQRGLLARARPQALDRAARAAPPAAGRPRARSRSRSTRTTRSARSSAATRSSRTPRASR